MASRAKSYRWSRLVTTEVSMGSNSPSWAPVSAKLLVSITTSAVGSFRSAISLFSRSPLPLVGSTTMVQL